MLLDLKPILVTPGASLPFETREDLSDLVFGSCKPASKPVLAYGKVRNTAGVLERTGELTTTLHGVCDRCAEPIQKPMSLSLHKILVEDLQNREDADDEYVLVQDSALDLSDLLREELLLFFPTKMLCKPDCKGLCCKCGKNLNDGPCDCQKDVDPRLEALLQLLD